MKFNGKGKKGVKEDGRIQGKDSHFSARSRGMVSIAGQLYLQRCPQLQIRVRGEGFWAARRERKVILFKCKRYSQSSGAKWWGSGVGG